MSQTSRERVTRCLKFETPDRLPRELWTLPWAFAHHPDTMRLLNERFPCDFGGPAGGAPSPRPQGRHHRAVRVRPGRQSRDCAGGLRRVGPRRCRGAAGRGAVPGVSATKHLFGGALALNTATTIRLPRLALVSGLDELAARLADGLPVELTHATHPVFRFDFICNATSPIAGQNLIRLPNWGSIANHSNGNALARVRVRDAVVPGNAKRPARSGWRRTGSATSWAWPRRSATAWTGKHRNALSSFNHSPELSH